MFLPRVLRVMNEKTFQSNVSAAITYVGTYSKLSNVCIALKNCLSQSKGKKMALGHCNYSCFISDGKLTGNHIATVIDHLLLVHVAAGCTALYHLSLSLSFLHSYRQHVYCPTTLTLHEAVCYNGNKRTPYHIL